MSSPNNAGPSQRVFYTACNTCNVVLAVSVPGSSFTETVAVLCERCGTIWAVNLAAAFQSSQDSQNYPSESSGSSCPIPCTWTGTQTATSRKRAVNPSLRQTNNVKSCTSKQMGLKTTSAVMFKSLT